jgi:hypothetical protein
MEAAISMKSSAAAMSLFTRLPSESAGLRTGIQLRCSLWSYGARL